MRATRKRTVPDCMIEKRAAGPRQTRHFPENTRGVACARRAPCSDMPTLTIDDFELAKPAGEYPCW